MPSQSHALHLVEVEENDGYTHADECAAFLESGVMSQNEFARVVGISSSLVWQYCNRDYDVKLETRRKHDRAIGEALRTLKLQMRGPIAREDYFVQTTHAQWMTKRLEWIARSSKMRLLRANTGMGKTHSIRHFAAQNDNVFIVTCRASRRNLGRPFYNDVYRAVLRQPVPAKKRLHQLEDDIFEALINLNALLIFDDAQELDFRTLKWVASLYNYCKRLGVAFVEQMDSPEAPGYDRSLDFANNLQIRRRLGRSQVMPQKITAADVGLYLESFGITIQNASGQERWEEWFVERVNLPYLRYAWLAELVLEAVATFGDEPELLSSLETYQQLHQMII